MYSFVYLCVYIYLYRGYQKNLTFAYFYRGKLVARGKKEKTLSYLLFLCFMNFIPHICITFAKVVFLWSNLVIILDFLLPHPISNQSNNSNWIQTFKLGPESDIFYHLHSTILIQATNISHVDRATADLFPLLLPYNLLLIYQSFEWSFIDNHMTFLSTPSNGFPNEIKIQILTLAHKVL